MPKTPESEAERANLEAWWRRVLNKKEQWEARIKAMEPKKKRAKETGKK